MCVRRKGWTSANPGVEIKASSLKLDQIRRTFAFITNDVKQVWGSQASYWGRFRSPTREKNIHGKESCRWRDKFYLAVCCSINIHRAVKQHPAWFEAFKTLTPIWGSYSKSAAKTCHQQLNHIERDKCFTPCLCSGALGWTQVNSKRPFHTFQQSEKRVTWFKGM